MKTITFNDAIIFGAALVCGGILLFIWFIAGTTEWIILRKYFFASGCSFLFFIGSLFLPRQGKSYVVIITLSLGAGLYIAESFLSFTLVDRKSPLEKAVRAAGQSFDYRTTLQVITDMRKETNQQVLPYISPKQLFKEKGLRVDGETIYPLGFVPESRLVYCNEDGQYPVYEVDKFGYNNPPNQFDMSNTDAVIVGDSFAFASCVNTGEGPAGVMRRAGYSVYNLGMPGAGPILQLAAIIEFAVSLKPRYVFWFYYEGNDLRDLAIEKELPVLSRYLEKDFSQQLVERQSAFVLAHAAYARDYLAKAIRDDHKKAARNKPIMKFLKLNEIRKIANLDRNRTKQPFPDSLINKLKYVLATAQEKVSQWNGELVFVYLPEWSRYGSEHHEPTLQARPRVLEAIRSLSIPVIDFDQAISPHDDWRSFFAYGLPNHYNPGGYGVLAQNLVGFIENRNSATKPK